MRVTINGLCQDEKFIRHKYKRTEETLCYRISKSHSFTLIWHKFSVFTFPISVYNIVWPFNKKTTIAASGILAGATDHHSHILPGVDDGVETMDEALRILDSYEALGIKELWLTPHIMEDVPNTPDKLAERFAELQTAYKGNITLHLAAEYMIDNHLRKLLQEIKDSPSFQRGATRGSVACDDGCFSTPKECPTGAAKGEGVELRPTLEGAVRSHSTACDDGYFSTPKECPQGSNPSEDRRGEKSPMGYPFGTTEESKTTSNKLLHSLEGRWHEQSEVTEGSNTPKEYPLGTTEESKLLTRHLNLLPIGSKGNHLLVETSYFNPPMRLKETLRLIKSRGYYPLLAHPERYMYMEKKDYLELNEEGVKFQLNIISLAGSYGNTVKKKAEWLLSNRLYSVAGSDLHCEDAIEFITGCRLGEKEMETLKIILKNTI